MTEQKRLKSALFVDFDNIYLGLRQLDEDAAEKFASNPAHWLKWLEEGMPGLADQGKTSEKRDILIRQCYLNPRGFQQYRPYFTRSAFSVVDCPSLTSQGKNSADIYMVMDILDTLTHPTHFDEFIILSGDTDFMPVMLRLREYDRRTTILSAGPAAAAFLAAANLIISEDVFIEHALDVGGEEGRKSNGGATVTSTATPELLDAIAEKLYAEASANGEILATFLPKLYRNFPEFRRDSNWLGFFSLRALTTHLCQRNPNLRITEGDPWRVTVALPRSRKKSARQSNGKSAYNSNEDKLRRRIVDLVRRMVADSSEPILMGRAAQEVINRTGKQVLESHWAGAGTFKNLLQSEENLGIEIATSPSPGYLYDPERHALPREDEMARKEEDVPPKLAEFSKRISRITGAPNLTPRQYAMLFTAMAEDLKEHTYHLTSTSKAVRDRVIEWGEAISRANINNVLKGVAYAKHRFSKRDTPQSLARVYRSYLLSRCEDAELELSREEKRLLREWIEGGLRDLKKKKDEKKNGDAKATENGDVAKTAPTNGKEGKKKSRKPSSSRKSAELKKEAKA
jgi:hypothetical protein